MDSLVAVEIRSWFMKELGVDMPVLKILGGASAADLVLDAVEKLPEEFMSKFKAAPAEAAATAAVETPASDGSSVHSSSASDMTPGSEQHTTSSPPSEPGSDREAKGDFLEYLPPEAQKSGPASFKL